MSDRCRINSGSNCASYPRGEPVLTLCRLKAAWDTWLRAVICWSDGDNKAFDAVWFAGLLEKPVEAEEANAITQAKYLYRSCLNMSK